MGGIACTPLPAPSAGLAAKDALMLEILAGPVIYRASDVAQQLEINARVVFASYSAPRCRSVEGAREQKQALWGDSSRNRAIAEVASAFRESDERVLGEHGVFLDAEQASLLLTPSPVVVVLVESFDHGKHLQKLLLGWQFKHAMPTNNGEGSPHGAAWSPWGVQPNTIITVAAAAENQLFHAKVLVLAGGGKWPQLPECLSKQRAPMLLVDFADESNPSLVSETQQRLRAYQALGYTVLGAGPGSSAEATIHAARSPIRESRHRQPITSRRQRRPNCR